MSGSTFPASCSLLSEGQVFEGSAKQEGNLDNTWSVQVKLQACDVQKGYICGTIDGKRADGESVVNFWEGEIIDNTNWTFHDSKWDLDWEVHNVQWEPFPEFHPLLEEMEKDLANYPYIFMRWKEELSWSLLYCPWMPLLHHACFSKRDGHLITRFQQSPSSFVYKLDLRPIVHSSLSGYSFPTYEFQ